jgi:hypothetical protein
MVKKYTEVVKSDGGLAVLGYSDEHACSQGGTMREKLA